MGIDLYYMPGSSPSRSVLLTAAALDVPLNLKLLNLMAFEQMNPEYAKINPQRKIPTLVDNGFIVCESRAIMRYLVNKYGQDSKLYPKELKIRTIIDQRLDFDLGTLYPSFADYFYPQLFYGAVADKAQFKKLQEALRVLNIFLESQIYAAGSHLTLADLSLVATVSTIDAAGISLTKYPNVIRWFEHVKTTAPNYGEANEKGVQSFKQVAQMLLKSKL